jgi:hypothetical protein
VQAFGVLSSLVARLRFFEGHDGALPGPGWKRPSRLWDLVAVASLVTPVSAASHPCALSTWRSKSCTFWMSGESALKKYITDAMEGKRSRIS